MIFQDHYNAKLIFDSIAQGNKTAFESLFMQYKEKVYAAALKWTKSAYAAEEITQDTFIALWSSRTQLASVNDPQAYLFTIVANKVSRHLQKESNRNRILEVASRNKKAFSNETEETIYAKESNNSLEHAIAKLPPQKKIIYRLSHQQGKSYDEIADSMHLSRNTVKSHLLQAVKLIREYMREHALLLIWLLAYLLK